MNVVLCASASPSTNYPSHNQNRIIVYMTHAGISYAYKHMNKHRNLTTQHNIDNNTCQGEKHHSASCLMLTTPAKATNGARGNLYMHMLNSSGGAALYYMVHGRQRMANLHLYSEDCFAFTAFAVTWICHYRAIMALHTEWIMNHQYLHAPPTSSECVVRLLVSKVRFKYWQLINKFGSHIPLSLQEGIGA